MLATFNRTCSLFIVFVLFFGLLFDMSFSIPKVYGAAATHFYISTPANAAEGTSFKVVVRALDSSGEIDTGYIGTVNFISSDGTASLPANTKLTNGVGTFSATLHTPGSGQTISVTDTVTAITATSNPINVIGQADLSLQVEVSNITPKVGDLITYTLTLTNSGPDAATGVKVTAALPAGVAFASGTSSQGTYDQVAGVWGVGKVTAGSKLTLAIAVKVASPNTQIFTVIVSQSDQSDPNPVNNMATSTVSPINVQADLSLQVAVSNKSPKVGDLITYTVTLTNSGPYAATGVKVSALLPAGVTFASGTSSQGTYDQATGVWVVGSVLIESQQTLTIAATVTSPNAQISTSFAAFADQPDPNPGNNSATSTVSSVNGQADLSLQLVASNKTPKVGDLITYTATLTNSGPDAATGVKVSALLPASITFVSGTSSQGKYDQASGEWTVGKVAAGSQLTLKVAATVISPNAQISTSFAAFADQPDPNPGNNSATSTVVSHADVPNDPDVPNEVNHHLPYINGYEDGSFKPDMNMTRAEIASILYSFIANKEGAKPSKFKDVSSGAWYEEAVSYLSQHGMLNGYDDGTFKANQPITRAELTTVLTSYFKLTLTDTITNKFIDVGAQHWAKKYIDSAAVKGWINGYEDDMFRPDKNVTRAEAVVIVNRALVRKVDPSKVETYKGKFTDIAGHWAAGDIIEAAVAHDYVKVAEDKEKWK
ncbi:S-layer homology domain-containing protein [Paenibacillus sp. Soil787]|uniref:S-layer homology domain-containing protein n=1 Tax=Paenibacillus sp. Soil787 TaxID=1736411 RepID=UPI0006FCDC6B|nr:S-layer homology domain-containing protein [Paenibacillus sp. Soil787]KRF35897.1 hypothetical protein ASG93_25800 [Paenibacillus sp. Soil787]